MSRRRIRTRGLPEANPNPASEAAVTFSATLACDAERTPVAPIPLEISDADLFRSLPRISLVRLLMLSRARWFTAGSQLLRPDGGEGRLLVISAGRVQVDWFGPQLARAAVLGEFGPGETVGEIGILHGYRPALTVVALEDTAGWLITHGAVALTMLHDTETRLVLARRLAERRRAFVAQVNRILQQDTAGSSPSG